MLNQTENVAVLKIQLEIVYFKETSYVDSF